MSKTNPEELVKFYRLIKSAENIPEEYEPHLFRCRKEGKPPLPGVPWKKKSASLSIDQAVRYMKHGGNIGVAGRENGPLVLVDKDKLHSFDVSLKTLKVKTRSRSGYHYYFLAPTKIPNIAVDGVGEVRASWQYCLAPGSYVPTTEEEAPKNATHIGEYTLEDHTPPKWIMNRTDLPEVFKQQHRDSESKEPRKKTDFDPKKAKGDYSALYDLTITDILDYWDKSEKEKERWTFDPDKNNTNFHPEASKTDANMSVGYSTSNENGGKEKVPGGILHCWRHLVSHGPIQTLSVFSGYLSCGEAGTPHKDSSYGPSQVIGDDGAIFQSWVYAKKNGLIPAEDPVPTRALKHIARKHGVYDALENEKLPYWAYQRSLKILEEDY